MELSFSLKEKNGSKILPQEQKIVNKKKDWFDDRIFFHRCTNVSWKKMKQNQNKKIPLESNILRRFLG